MYEWELYWLSSQNERYDDVMLPKAHAIVDESGLNVLDRFGGSDLQCDENDPNGADNGYIVAAPDDDTPLKLARDLTEALGKQVRVTQLEAVGG